MKRNGYVSVSELAEYFGVSGLTIRRMEKNGKLKGFRLGGGDKKPVLRFFLGDVREFERKKRVEIDRKLKCK